VVLVEKVARFRKLFDDLLVLLQVAREVAVEYFRKFLVSVEKPDADL
jgi:hypothetical protein